MKNKHIVLLFGATFLVGLLLRQMPWQMSSYVQKRLLHTDSTQIQKVNIQRPTFAELTLERTDIGWSVSQSGRFVNTTMDLVLPILSALQQMELHQIVRSDQPDTLGFSIKEAITIEVFGDKIKPEGIQIGRVILVEGFKYTYVLVPQHEGVYLLKGDFRTVFLRKLDQFRLTNAFSFDPKSINTITVYNKDTCFIALMKGDTSVSWHNNDFTCQWPSDSCETWLTMLQKMNNMPFADYFDEGYSDKLFRIELGIAGKELPLQLNIYKVNQFELPEEYKEQSFSGAIAPFVLNSSYNRDNYFALTNTDLLIQVLGYLPNNSTSSIIDHAPKTK